MSSPGECLTARMLLACDVRLCLALPRRDYCLEPQRLTSAVPCAQERVDRPDPRSTRSPATKQNSRCAHERSSWHARCEQRLGRRCATRPHPLCSHTRTLCWQSCLAAGALDLVDHSGTTLAGTTLEGTTLIGVLLDHASFAGTSLAGTSIVGTSNRLAARPCTPGALAPWGPCSVLSTSAAPSTRARCSATPNNECMLSCASPRVACVQKRAVV